MYKLKSASTAIVVLAVLAACVAAQAWWSIPVGVAFLLGLRTEWKPLLWVCSLPLLVIFIVALVQMGLSVSTVVVGAVTLPYVIVAIGVTLRDLLEDYSPAKEEVPSQEQFQARPGRAPQGYKERPMSGQFRQQQRW